MFGKPEAYKSVNSSSTIEQKVVENEVVENGVIVEEVEVIQDSEDQRTYDLITRIRRFLF